MALGPRDPDRPTPLEIQRNKPAEVRHKKSKVQKKQFFRKRDPRYTYAFGMKWESRHPEAIDKNSEL